MLFTKRPFTDLAREIRANLGKTKVTEPKADYNNTQENKARIRKILKTCTKLTPEGAVARYLAGRGLTVLPELNVYECWQIPYHEDKPAMVAVFRTPDGGLSTIQVTYLQGDKSVTKKERKFMPVVKPMAGSSVKLFEVKDSICAVCEGTESALAIYEKEGIQVFAAGSATGMEKIELPDYIKHVYIYADSDKNFVGQAAAYSLAKRLQNKGLEVRVCLLIDRDLVVDAGDKFDMLDFMILKDYENQSSTSRSGLGLPAQPAERTLWNHSSRGETGRRRAISARGV